MEGIDLYFQPKTIELKRKLIAHRQLPAHRCQHCEEVLSALSPPLGQGSYKIELLTVVETKSRVGELARSGCQWWSLISSLIRFLLSSKSESSRVAAPGSGQNALDPYNNLDPELPPARREHESCWYSNGEVKGGLDSNQFCVELTHTFLKYPGKEKALHKVSVFPSEGVGISAALMIYGHHTSFVRGSEHLASPINIEPGGASSFALARHWINHCATSHDCGILDAPDLMPRILLDLNKLNMENNVRITETEPLFRAPYVALSYCWGRQDQKVILTRQEKARLLEGISIEQLDQTIQDAIKVARELEFRYLWIDALCIMQDDSTEKAHDISHMHDIYRNAAFTIIASRSASVTEGFLSSREVTGAKNPNTIFSLVSGNDTKAHSNSIIATLKEDYIKRPWKHTEPWESRAWTLQERLSSGRFLRFGSHQTHWSCLRGESDYRDCDGGLLPYQQQDTNEYNFSVATAVMNETPTGLDPEKLRQIWYKIVVRYTGMDLTYPTDRLPAISSIARAFARVLEDDYVGGHWRSSLHVDLLWRNGTSRPDIPNMSWSWASGCGEIRWDFFGPIHLYHGPVVADADFQFVGLASRPASNEDPYGAVDLATLTLRGLLVPFPHSNLLSLPLSSSADSRAALSCHDMNDQQRRQQEERAQADLKLGRPHPDLGCIVWGHNGYRRDLHGDHRDFYDDPKLDPKTRGEAIGLVCQSPLFLFPTARLKRAARNPQTVVGLLLQYEGERSRLERRHGSWQNTIVGF
ncbi:hypothetical protein PG984_014804 [Apiospora sp. TS-2023a]